MNLNNAMIQKNIMRTFPYPIQKIGLIGGGQLGKMLVQIAKKMGFYVTILDPSPRCPAASLADQVIIGHFYEADKIKALAAVSEVLTYEIEHVDTQTLLELQQAGHQILPSPEVLAIIQDKLKQKKILKAHNIPVPAFEAITELTPSYLAQVALPVVQKTRCGGYDGKGVMILKSLADSKHILTKPSIIEEFVDVAKELAIIIARTADGKTVCYPVVEMIFDDKTNICDIVAVPARIEAHVAQRAQQLALQAIEVLEGVGVFAVEMFLTASGQILVNEIAPRPHNSGHYTIEACMTSQFEQLIRIISGLPLGASTLLTPAVMLNLVGEPGYQGVPQIEGLEEVLAIAGLSFHFYGKEITQPSRKMGHITVLDAHLDDAIAKIHQIKNIVKITAKDFL
ncbi:MAG: 5-(carboxyamino)imidazole ribonucleotide synthase [Pseudomonadota bacterium]|nr:5-(carboxyamino)imidazole ribonucleotide synthase [Pseudomonadota bacterium]